MRVLWLVRDNLTRHPGGDTVQILETARALRDLDVDVELCGETTPDLNGYDCVHLFHLDRLWENEPHCRRIAARGIPAVLSPIYWPADQFDQYGRVGLQGRLARLLGSEAYRNLRLMQRWAIACVRDPARRRLPHPSFSFMRSARFVLDTVSVLLPNSRAEQANIEQLFGRVPPSVIVPNAADARLFHPPSRPWPEGRVGVLCVGRIEPRKNQLALIRALRGTGIPLTLVGRPGRYSAHYARCCKREADAYTCFLGHHDAEALRALYCRAQVHASVSWYETPGLANLEAALCGCAIVATPGGCTREYLGDAAIYCHPGEPGSIRKAVMDALSDGPNPALRERVAHMYTWSAAAQKTLEGYRRALENPVDARRCSES